MANWGLYVPNLRFTDRCAQPVSLMRGFTGDLKEPRQFAKRRKQLHIFENILNSFSISILIRTKRM